MRVLQYFSLPQNEGQKYKGGGGKLKNPLSTPRPPCIRSSRVTTISSEVKRVLKKIAETYITLLIKQIDGYFFNDDNPSGVVREVHQ